MLKFLVFKSKEFLSITSLIITSRTTQREISLVQTEKNNAYLFFSRYKTIFGRLHSEENFIHNNKVYDQPATSEEYGTCRWYRNNKIKRVRKDENGYSLYNELKYSDPYTDDDEDIDFPRETSKHWFNTKFRLDRVEKGKFGDLENGYFKNGEYIPYTLPAVVCSNGSLDWYKNGDLHRDDIDENGEVLPARIRRNGDKEWYKNGKRHRDDLDEKGRVLPTYIGKDGSLFWFKNGEKHRNDLDENGRVLPAVIWNKGRKKEWWINGEKVSL